MAIAREATGGAGLAVANGVQQDFIPVMSGSSGRFDRCGQQDSGFQGVDLSN